MSAEHCPVCKGSGWVEPWGWRWDRHLGQVLDQIGPAYQCKECQGTGYRKEANVGLLKDVGSDSQL